MKKLLLFVALVIFSLNAKAQDIEEKIKGGGFYVGANIGLPISGASDISTFNFGFDVAYLFELIDNLEVGGLLGYTHFVGDDFFGTKYEDASFIPIAASARYYFANHRFFGGVDLGVGINAAGDAKSGFYARPKFGFDLGTVALIASFQSISGGTDYRNNGTYYYRSYSSFTSFNFGVEFGF
ncbi:hypothetical protein [Hanstruepera ponticola]|uniref:hypothetical protein n=1 Tax=Hanstruepera ponticola TaxID=2042995 RepID=UPI000CF1BC42|nr:hypothetical protein [Hanstruepera ponticola]